MPLKVPTTNPNGALLEDSFKYSPLEHVRSLFIGFFQGLFYASPVGAYHWEQDDEQSEIYISDENSVKSETLGQRPAVTCTRGPVQFYSLGLDDLLNYDTRTGKKTKSVLVPGTMVINCSSRVQLECERIAWICAEQLWIHRDMLMAAGFFEIGRQPSIGSPSPAGSVIVSDSGDEWYTAPVTCPFQFVRTSAATPLNKRIAQNIQLSIRARLERVSQQYKSEVGYGGAPASPVPGFPTNVTREWPPAFAPEASDVYGNTPVAGQSAPHLLTLPHPRNPAQRVIVRAVRPNQPALQPASMGGRPIPIATGGVEQSCGNQMVAHVHVGKAR